MTDASGTREECNFVFEVSRGRSLATPTSDEEGSSAAAGPARRRPGSLVKRGGRSLPSPPLVVRCAYARDLNALSVDPAVVLGKQRRNHGADIVRQADTAEGRYLRDMLVDFRIIPNHGAAEIAFSVLLYAHTQDCIAFSDASPGVALASDGADQDSLSAASEGECMKAIPIHEFGGSSQIEEVSDPAAGQNQIVVCNLATRFNPIASSRAMIRPDAPDYCAPVPRGSRRERPRHRRKNRRERSRPESWRCGFRIQHDWRHLCRAHRSRRRRTCAAAGGSFGRAGCCRRGRGLDSHAGPAACRHRRRQGDPHPRRKTVGKIVFTLSTS